MAHPVTFTGANCQMNPPEGREDIQAMEVFKNGNAYVSCWQLTEAELTTIIKNGGKVFVSHMGNYFQPLFVGDDKSVRAVVADYGKTIPQQK